MKTRMINTLILAGWFFAAAVCFCPEAFGAAISIDNTAAGNIVSPASGNITVVTQTLHITSTGKIIADAGAVVLGFGSGGGGNTGNIGGIVLSNSLGLTNSVVISGNVATLGLSGYVNGGNLSGTIAGLTIGSNTLTGNFTGNENLSGSYWGTNLTLVGVASVPSGAIFGATGFLGIGAVEASTADGLLPLVLEDANFVNPQTTDSRFASFSPANSGIGNGGLSVAAWNDGVGSSGQVALEFTALGGNQTVTGPLIISNVKKSAGARLFQALAGAEPGWGWATNGALVETLSANGTAVLTGNVYANGVLLGGGGGGGGADHTDITAYTGNTTTTLDGQAGAGLTGQIWRTYVPLAGIPTIVTWQVTSSNNATSANISTPPMSVRCQDWSTSGLIFLQIQTANYIQP